MTQLYAILALAFTISACSSSAPVSNDSEPSPSAPVVQEKVKSPAAGKTAAPAIKSMKCTYDTDCMVQNSCVNEKCKLTGNDCRFRSDCPTPRGTCVNKVCQFN